MAVGAIRSEPGAPGAPGAPGSLFKIPVGSQSSGYQQGEQKISGVLDLFFWGLHIKLAKSLAQLGRFLTRIDGSGVLALAKMRRAISSGVALILGIGVEGRPWLAFDLLGTRFTSHMILIGIK